KLEVAFEQIVVVLGVQVLGDAGRADEIAEQDRDLLPLALDHTLGGADAPGEPFRNVTRQAGEGIAHWRRRGILGRAADPPTARRTEAKALIERRPTTGAAESRRCPACVAELLSGDELGAA